MRLSSCPDYFARLDRGEDIIELLAPEFAFALLWSAEGRPGSSRAGSTNGGLHGAATPEDSCTTSASALREASTEIASGWTTRHGSPLGTFLFAVELDDEGRARRLYAARTESFLGVPF